MPEHTTIQSPPFSFLPRTVDVLPEFASAPVLITSSPPNTPASTSSILEHPSTPPQQQQPSLHRGSDRNRDRDHDRSRDRPRDRSCDPAPKKPRTWSAMFKRRPTALAAAAAADNVRAFGIKSSAIQTQTEFRRNFLKLHKDRVIRDEQGNYFRLHPIVMNGDCGFGAIAKGMNCARARVKDITPNAADDAVHSRRRRNARTDAEKRGRLRRRRLRDMVWGSSSKRNTSDKTAKILQAKDIRKAMYDELRKARKTYLEDCEEFKGIYTDDDFDRLEREVSQPGIAGHWLGTVLGLLEHVIVAHAMNINIFLYQFDLQKQCVRRFESATVENPDCEVYLFFTGPAACGHFDTLVKITDPKKHMFAA